MVQWEKVYNEIDDAIDLLYMTTAAKGSEDSLGLAELALIRAREVLHIIVSSSSQN